MMRILLSLIALAACADEKPDCFKVVEGLENSPPSGFCVANGYIVELETSHYFAREPDADWGDIIIATSDPRVELYDELKANVGKPVRISGKYKYDGDAYLNLKTLSEFELLENLHVIKE